jgi:SNF2 family DNA or RNA helicase
MGRSFGALFLDMGAGKTRIMIDLIVQKGFKRTLIIAPKRVCRVWAPEFQKHAPEENITVLDVFRVPGGKRIHWLKSNTPDVKIAQEVIVCNYESVWREPLRSYLLKGKLDAVICDESHRIKTPGSKTSRFLQLLGRRVPNRYIMTGTFLAQGPLDSYAQYRFIDPNIFGTNHTVFKEEYGNWIKAPGGFAFLNKKNPYKNLDKLHDKIFSCAFSVDVDLNLPPTQDILVEFDLSRRAEKYYKELVKEGCLELKSGTLETGNILTVITRLQQLTSGYLPLEDEDGNKTIQLIDTSRQDAFKELLEDIPEDEPVVVFAKYRKDINNIRNIVRDIGRKSSELSGRRDTLDRWQAGKTQVLVVQIASGAEGNDFTRAKYCIYYTLSQSLSKYKQSRKRIHRPGQTRPVVYYTLVAKMKKGKTIDEQIVESLQKNENIVSKIMESREV